MSKQMQTYIDFLKDIINELGATAPSIEQLHTAQRLQVTNNYEEGCLNELITDLRSSNKGLTHLQVIMRKVKKKPMGYKTPCWIYPRSPNQIKNKEYPTYRNLKNREIRIHKLMYHHRYGKMTGNQTVVRHLCHNGREGCINPFHLDAGTVADNARDSYDQPTASSVPTTIYYNDNTTEHYVSKSEAARQLGLPVEVVGYLPNNIKLPKLGIKRIVFNEKDIFA